MPRAFTTKHQTSFLNGVVDSGNEFNAPENALVSSLNVVLSKDGILQTRPALSPDGSLLLAAVPTSLGFPNQYAHPSLYEWESTKSAGAYTSLKVVALGASACVYKETPSGGKPVYSDNFVLSSTWSGANAPMSFTTYSTVLVVAQQSSLPTVVTPSVSGTSVSVSTAQFTPMEKDFYGVDDGYPTGYNPLSHLMNASAGASSSAAGGDEIVGLTSGHRAFLLTDVAVGSQGPYGLMYMENGAGFQVGETIQRVVDGANLFTVGAITLRDGLTASHLYNLINQGWSNALIKSYAVSRGKFPSNAQVWTAGKDSNNNFSPVELDKLDFGETPAPKGSTTLEILNHEREVVDPVTGVTVPLSVQQVLSAFSGVATYANRLWLFGGSDRLEGRVFYSQDLTNTSLVPGDDTFLMSKFYPVNDLTSEYLNDTYPTDGGSITIEGSGKVYAGVVIGMSLVIFAANGVWEISGAGDGVSFDAQSISLRKVTTHGVRSGLGVVPVGDAAFYMGRTGVFQVNVDQFGSVSATDIGRTRIDKLWESNSELTEAIGTFDRNNRRVIWCHRRDDAPDINFPTLPPGDKRGGLVLDLANGGFYPQDYAYDSRLSPTSWSSPVGYVDSAGDTFMACMRYTTTWNVFFMKQDELVTHDWGVPATDTDGFSAHFETWPEHLGAPNLDKAVETFSAFFRRTETQWVDDGAGGVKLDYPSGCTVSAHFGWTDPWNKTWTDPQQAYVFSQGTVSPGVNEPVRNGKTVVETKLQFRGAEPSVSFRFEKEPRKVFQFLGYSVGYSAESTP